MKIERRTVAHLIWEQKIWFAYSQTHPVANYICFDVKCSKILNDILITESRAICRYICDKYPDSGNKSLFGHKDSILERASIDQWLEAESQSFNPPSLTLIYQLAFATRLGLKQDPASIDQSEAKLSKVLDVYEQRLGESKFLAGDEFTLADLSHLPNSEYLVNATNKGGSITERKNVGRWWKDISSRECWKVVVEMMEVAKAPPS